MKIDLDKFTLSQKIYSTIGALIAIITFMIPERYFPRISLGILLLTAIVVFFLKYNVFRKAFNTIVILLILVSGGFIARSLYISSHPRSLVEDKAFFPTQTEPQLAPIDYSYYAICTSNLNRGHEVYSDVIYKCPTQTECQKFALNCKAPGLISKEVVQSNERLRKIFEELPVGNWYLIYINKVEDLLPMAEVYRVTPDAELDVNYEEQLAIARVEEFREKCKNADCAPLEIRVISPDGKITRHNVSTAMREQTSQAK